MVRYTRSLIRAALGLSLVLATAPLAVAQEPPDGIQAVLSQLDSPTSGRPQTSTWTSDLVYQRKIAADDFIVPVGTDWWKIDQISIIGMMCLDPGYGDQVHAVFYSNVGDQSDGRPGPEVVRTATDVAQGMAHSCSIQNGEMQYDLTPQKMIWLRPAQKYWLSVHGVVTGEVYNRLLFWTGRSGWVNQPAFYYSGAPPCQDQWVLLTVCDGEAIGDDMSWSLTYTPIVITELYAPMLSKQ